MEREVFLSGYCRTIDDSRMVAVEVDGTSLLDVDCCYSSCVHLSNCPVAEKIRQLLAEDRSEYNG